MGVPGTTTRRTTRTGGGALSLGRRMPKMRRGYFSGESSEDDTTAHSSPCPRTVAPPTPWVPPLEAEKVSVLRFAQHPGQVLWDRECSTRTVVRAVEVAPTILVTESLVCALRDGAGRECRVSGALARSNRTGLCVDLSKVPSTARHARHMIVLHSDDSLEKALGGDRVRVAVNDDSSDSGSPESLLKLWYGPSPDNTAMRLRFEASVPKLEVRCSRLASFPRLRGTRLAFELSKNGGRDIGQRFGLVALDENGEVVVLLEDDPTTRRVPIVGAWISGISSGGADPCADPFVLEACSKLFAQKFWFVEPDTALLLIFASRPGGGTTLSFVEATAIYQTRTDSADSRALLDFVADVDHRAPPPTLQKNKRHRAIIAARLLPTSTSGRLAGGGRRPVVPQRITTDYHKPADPAPPSSLRTTTEPSVDALRRNHAPLSPDNDDDDRASLQAQLVELRKRLEELENKRQMPAGCEIATETTDTLLHPRRPAVERATETTETLLLARKPATPSSPPDDAATDTDDLREPVEHRDVEVSCDISLSQHQQSFESAEMQPETTTPAPCHTEPVAHSAFDEDEDSNSVDDAATAVETLVIPRIVCPRDVEDLLRDDDDDEDDHASDVARATCVNESHSTVHSSCNSVDDWTQPRYLLDPTSLTHLDCEDD